MGSRVHLRKGTLQEFRSGHSYNSSYSRDDLDNHSPMNSSEEAEAEAE